MSNNPYYSRIMALREAEDIKQVAQRWQRLSENIKKSPPGAPIIIPDMLWVAKSGVGKTNLLMLISEYLCMEGIMEFYGDVKFFEFLLSYIPKGEYFSELPRLMEEISAAAGFRSEYKGVVGIDIDEWVEHIYEPHFISLMEYLSSYSDNWLIIFIIHNDDPGVVKRTEALLSTFMRIERVTLALPKAEHLQEYVLKQLAGYGLRLTPEANQLLLESIDELRKNKDFDGFKTIRLLCKEIIYTVFSCEGWQGNTIPHTMLSRFAKDGEYVTLLKTNNEKRRIIGFGTEGAEQ